MYKICARQENGRWVPTIKVSNNPEKVTNPGIKQVWRFTNASGSPLADLIGLDEDPPRPGVPHTFHHPMGDYRTFTLGEEAAITPLLSLRMRGGVRVGERPSLLEAQSLAAGSLERLDDTYKRLLNPHVYKVSLSTGLHELKSRLIQETLPRGATP